MSLQLILTMIEKYVMADLRNWTKVWCLNKTLCERYTHVVAKIYWVLWFQDGVHFCLLALITLSIFVRFPLSDLATVIQTKENAI